MQNTKFTGAFYAIVSGTMLTLSFPPIPLFLLAFIGFLPLLYYFLENESKNKYKLIYLAFFIYHAGANWWIGSWQAETDPYLTASGIVLALGHPFFFMIPFIPFFYIKRKMGKVAAIWSFPVFWTTFEWLHSLGEASYPWLTLGNTQIYNHYWIQFIDLTGVWGASFLLLAFNSVALRLIYLMKERTKSESKDHKGLIGTIAALLLILILPMIYGAYKTKLFDDDKLLLSNKTINVSLIQPAINPWKKWSGGVWDQILTHQAIQDSLADAVGEIDLTIWSETSIPFADLSLNAFHHYPQIRAWVDKNNTSLLTGFSEMKIFTADDPNRTQTARVFPNDSSQYFESYNSALLINPLQDNEEPQLYRKMKLTPFAERMPYSDALLFARSWFEWGVGISAWGIGRDQNNLVIRKGKDSVAIGTIICIESIYPNFCRKFAKQGAGILTVITNDAWYDYTVGPEQHYQIAAIRAIESRRYIARVANTGVTGFITPTGKSLQKAEQYKALGIAATIPILDYETFYVKAGDWFMTILSVFSVVIILLPLRKKSK